jgi:phosphoribosylformylglycinamidine synthase subunit PurQ / glutaminase
MKSVRALVLSGYGINCEREMAAGAALAGAQVEIVHAKAWLTGKVDLMDFDFLLFPGGFSFGDELGAAKAFANRIAFSNKSEELFRFIDRGKCILGVCNGFQLLVKLGVLPRFGKMSEAALIRNELGKFEARWVHQKVVRSRSIFTRDLLELDLPVRHGEGRFVMADPKRLWEEGRVVLQYAAASGEIAQDYPDNPNGSLDSIAGICDETGRVLGMMPHPEAALFFTQLPDWVRQKEAMKRNSVPIPDHGPGLALFKNVVEYLRQR